MLWLVKNGLTFDFAASLDPITSSAFCIIMSEHEGAEFDWETHRFKEQK